jgi:hypothetical protein
MIIGSSQLPVGGLRHVRAAEEPDRGAAVVGATTRQLPSSCHIALAEAIFRRW